MTTWRFVLLALSSVALVSAAPSISYPIGERLVCKAWFIGFIPIGTVWMGLTTGSYHGANTVVCEGRCLGDFKFYVADVRLASHLDPATDRALYHEIEQFGSERRGRRLIFDWQSNLVTYVRRERDGSYAVRRVVPITPDVWDVYSCAFQARKYFQPTVGWSHDVKLIETERVFHIRVTVLARRQLTIAGLGTFDACRLGFTPLNLKPHEVFKGLLNLDRDIEVWVESTTCTPLYMKSTVPFGFLRPKVEVVLAEWHTVPGFEPAVIGVSSNAVARGLRPRRD
ncbi:MAG: DUF3108 domain-containing protein [bacterium]|nr:DUF3108 domain-containing protein [bacterium]